MSSIKLIYQDGDSSYFVRYTDGTGNRVSKSEAEKLSNENNIPIGKSLTIPKNNKKVIWN